MPYYNQHHDPRYFANHPHFPEPPKSKSWIGWILLVISALIGGFLFGQSTKTEPFPQPEKASNETNDEPKPTNDKPVTFAAIIADEPQTEPEPTITEPVKFADLSDEVVANMTANFDSMSEADRLWFTKNFNDNPELIELYPQLAQYLGFATDEPEETDDHANPL